MVIHTCHAGYSTTWACTYLILDYVRTCVHFRPRCLQSSNLVSSGAPHSATSVTRSKRRRSSRRRLSIPNPSIAKWDLTSLIPLSAHTILSTLQARYANGCYYTFAGERSGETGPVVCCCAKVKGHRWLGIHMTYSLCCDNTLLFQWRLNYGSLMLCICLWVRFASNAAYYFYVIYRYVVCSFLIAFCHEGDIGASR